MYKIPRIRLEEKCKRNNIYVCIFMFIGLKILKCYYNRKNLYIYIIYRGIIIVRARTLNSRELKIINIILY